MTTRDDFLRLRDQRLAKVEDAIRILGNLSRYQRTPDDTTQTLTAVRNAVDELHSRFGVEVAAAPTAPPTAPAGPLTGAVAPSDRLALKLAFMTIKGGDTRRGLAAARKVFAGWSPPEPEDGR